MFRLLRLGDQLVDGLAREELVCQLNAPKSALDVSGLNQKCEAQSKCCAGLGGGSASQLPVKLLAGA